LPGAKFHAAFEVDGPDDDIPAGGQVAHEHVQAAALARPGDPADQGVSAQQQEPGGVGVLEWAEVDGFGDGADGGSGPGDGVGVWVGFEDAEVDPVSFAVGGG
jgi:hypothetical protein